MTSFGWWQDQANKGGLVLCMLCFESKPVEQMHVDEHGDTWDVCKPCQKEQEEFERLEHLKETTYDVTGRTFYDY